MCPRKRKSHQEQPSKSYEAQVRAKIPLHSGQMRRQSYHPNPTTGKTALGEKSAASLLLRRAVVRGLAERDVCSGSDRGLGAVAAVEGLA